MDYDKGNLSTIKYDVYNNPCQSARLGISNPVANAINIITCDHIRGSVYTYVERRINLPFIEDEITHGLTKHKV